jgi:hypothetical protein
MDHGVIVSVKLHYWADLLSLIEEDNNVMTLKKKKTDTT